MRTCTALPKVITGAALLVLSLPIAAAHAEPPNSAPRHVHQSALGSPPWNRLGSVNIAEGRVDPLIFFDELVARYRALTAYSDQTHIVEVTRRYDDGAEPQRAEKRVAADVSDGKLTVVTPGSQVRRSLGLALPIPPTPEMEQAAQRYDLWLVPHLVLKFSENPLEELREGVSEGFTATEAAAVTIDERPMVHLELTSGDGLSGDYNARFDLYIDPESMLIERIEGRQRMPDGADFETTYHITPIKSEGGLPVDKPAVSDPEVQPTSTTAPIAAPAHPDELPTASPHDAAPPAPAAQPTEPSRVG